MKAHWRSLLTDLAPGDLCVVGLGNRMILIIACSLTTADVCFGLQRDGSGKMVLDSKLIGCYGEKLA